MNLCLFRSITATAFQIDQKSMSIHGVGFIGLRYDIVYDKK